MLKHVITGSLLRVLLVNMSVMLQSMAPRRVDIKRRRHHLVVITVQPNRMVVGRLHLLAA